MADNKSQPWQVTYQFYLKKTWWWKPSGLNGGKIKHLCAVKHYTCNYFINSINKYMVKQHQNYEMLDKSLDEKIDFKCEN